MDLPGLDILYYLIYTWNLKKKKDDELGVDSSCSSRKTKRFQYIFTFFNFPIINQNRKFFYISQKNKGLSAKFFLTHSFINRF